MLQEEDAAVLIPSVLSSHTSYSTCSSKSLVPRSDKNHRYNPLPSVSIETSSSPPYPPEDCEIKWSSSAVNCALTENILAASPSTATAAHVSVQVDAEGVTPCISELHQDLCAMPSGTATVLDDPPAPQTNQGELSCSITQRDGAGSHQTLWEADVSPDMRPGL